MFKKIMIAMMAVMVFAIPIGASASANEPYTGYTHFVVFETTKGTYRLSVKSKNVPSADLKFRYTRTDTSSSIFADLVDSSLTPGTTGRMDKLVDGTWQLAYTDSSSGPNFSYGYQDSFGYINLIKSSNSSVFKTSYSSEPVFLAPPPPPKPVQIQAVKTVQEIVPQTATVAGGIVLAVSILLGVWLAVGLVRRLIYSYLR